MAWVPACAALVATAVAAQPGPPDFAPPSSAMVCPSIDLDYELCTGDLMSGNCADFVAAAGALAQLYQSEVAQHPDWKASLDTTLWWGCGSAPLSDIKALLSRIGTPEAKAVLESEPYRGLPEPRAKASKPPRPVLIDCGTLPTPKQGECAAKQLAAAEAAHARAYEACRAAVGPALRGPLVAGEKAWNVSKGIECDVGEDESQDPSLRTYSRSLCLAKATRQRTQAMLATHPGCAGGSDS